MTYIKFHTIYTHTIVAHVYSCRPIRSNIKRLLQETPIINARLIGDFVRPHNCLGLLHKKSDISIKDMEPNHEA